MISIFDFTNIKFVKFPSYQEALDDLSWTDTKWISIRCSSWTSLMVWYTVLSCVWGI